MQRQRITKIKIKSHLVKVHMEWKMCLPQQQQQNTT